MAKAKVNEAEEKSKLEKLRADMEKKYGKGTIISAGSKENFEVVSTGSVMFDKVTDCGGIPVGKLIEMFGPESSGKSTMALHIIAEFQKVNKKRKCLLADFEYSFDKGYAQKIGVDVDDLIITQPDTMEDGWNIILEYIKSGEISLIVLDSHTAMVPRARLEGEIGDAKMAPEARINSDALKKVKPELERSKCTLLGISQLRSQIGGMGNTGDKPTGGNSWKFYSDMRIKVYKMLDRQHEANKTFVEITKNKCGKPYGKAEMLIGWGIGIDKMQETLDLAIKYGFIIKSGAWYSDKDGNKIGQGAAAVKQLFVDNSTYYNDMRDEVVAQFKADQMETIEPVSETEEDKIPEGALTD